MFRFLIAMAHLEIASLRSNKKPWKYFNECMRSYICVVKKILFKKFQALFSIDIDIVFRNEDFPFQHYLRNQQPLRGSINQTVDRVAINPEVGSNYGYTSGYCYDHHSPYMYKQKLQDCWDLVKWLQYWWNTRFFLM